jgi:hypothetical protein
MCTTGISLLLVAWLCASPHAACAAEYHFSKNGNDASPGTQTQPFATISAAAAVAQPVM